MSDHEVRQWRHKPTGAIITVPIEMGGLGHTWEEYSGSPPSKSYTLDELEQLARDYCDDATSSARLEDRLRLSLFIQWARKREREVGE